MTASPSAEELQLAANRVLRATEELNEALAMANECGLLVLFDELPISQQIGRRYERKRYRAEVLMPIGKELES